MISRADYVSTPNGYDQRWIDAINAVMEDRERFDVRITDITDGFWDRFVGPMCDAVEDGTFLADYVEPAD